MIQSLPFRNTWRYKTKRASSSNIQSSRTDFGAYLAGQIEGDGSIIVPTGSNKKAYPIIKIVFNLLDLPLANLIQARLGGGIIQQTDVNWVVLVIQDLRTIRLVVSLINGHLRTPKIEALHRLIEWLNNHRSSIESIPLLGLSTCGILNNAWFAGFFEADGSFSVSYQLNQSGLPVKIKTTASIEQRQTYHRGNMESYFGILSLIVSAFHVKKVNCYVRSNGTSVYRAVLVSQCYF